MDRPNNGCLSLSVGSCPIAPNHAVMYQGARIEKESIEQGRIQKESVSSLVYYAIPSALQDRIPLLRSILKPMSKPRDGLLYSPSSSGTTTPASEGETVVAENENKENEIAMAEAVERNSPVVQDSLGDMASGTSPQLGVDWRCARIGVQLVASSQQEHDHGARQEPDLAFERGAYIDGVSYLLKGLPEALDEAEATVLKRALPATLGDPGAASGPPVRCRHGRIRHPVQQRSVLRRGTQILVAQAVVWFFIAWPYILIILQRVAHFERKHRVSEKVVGQSMEIASALTGHGANVSEAVCKMGDSNVSQALGGRLSRAIQGVAMGFSDGVEEGLSRVGARRK